MLAAFLTGLAGSLHCVGMCGPIALALPGGQSRGWRYLSGRLLYNVGRVTTYAALGGVISLLGVASALFELQQWVSIVAGGLLLLFAGRTWWRNAKGGVAKSGPFFQWWTRQMSNLMRYGHGRGLFAIGIINGLLPCGFVYLGLFQAALSGSVAEGALKMALFGMGTLPMMLSLSWSGKWVGKLMGTRGHVVMPILMAIMGIWFLVRGMGLGIPYLSPQMVAEKGHSVKMSCCERLEAKALNSPR